MRADFAILTPQDNDLGVNTNAALSCGAGLATYNAGGPHWKNLYSGGTY